MNNLVLLEFQSSREYEDSLKVAANIFWALPQPRGFLPGLIFHPAVVSCEISAFMQSTRFSLVTDQDHVAYLQALVEGTYPNVLSRVMEYDPVRTLDHWQEKTKIKPVIFDVKPGLFNSLSSIKSIQDFSNSDPLTPLLSFFSKLRPDDAVVFQMVLGAKGRFQLSQTANSAAQPADKVSTNQATQHNQALFATLRFGVWTPTVAMSNNLKDSLRAIVVNWSQDLGEPLRLSKPIFQQSALKAMIERKHGRTWQMNPDQAASLFHLPHKGLSMIHNIHWGKLLPGEPPENLPLVTRDQEPQDRQELNVLGRTIFKNQERVFAIKRADRRRHVYVIGKTGTGKSTLLANMAINDLKNDEGICVIDPHGDLVETILDFIPSRRINDVIHFDPSNLGKTVKINLFEGENLVHRELIASGIVSVFYKLYGYSWGPRLEYILRNALLTLLTADSARLSDITRLLTDAKFREKVTANLKDPVLASFWKNEFDNLQDRLRNEAIAPILNKVGQFVSSPMIRNVMDAQKSSFSIEQAMNEGKIILVNLSQGKLGEDNATLIGAMLITKIQLAAMSRVYKEEDTRKDFFLYVDEFQNFATDSFVKILSEARKYRLNLTLANQYIAQIPEEVQKAIFGNCGSMLSFVMGAEDSSLFAKEFNNLYTETDLVSLGRYQVISKLTIDGIVSRPFPAYTLPLAASSNKNREKVLTVSKERYAS